MKLLARIVGIFSIAIFLAVVSWQHLFLIDGGGVNGLHGFQLYL